MKLDVIIPTFNRASCLAKTLCSLATAPVPGNLDVTIIVVDNNSTDDTAKIFDEALHEFTQSHLEYVFEKKQGRSSALNAGLRKANGDLVAAIDDDERIQADWFIQLEKIFSQRWGEIDFVGGKVLPAFEIVEIPEWIEPLKDGVIGWRDYGDAEWQYGKDTPMLTGGHAIIKKKVFEAIGLYDESLGASGKNLMSCEDNILYDKLLSTGMRGFYFPQLVVFHNVPAYRLSKNYYRQWCFGAGVSWNLMDVNYKAYEGKRLFGVPLYMYRQTIADLVGKVKAMTLRNKTESLSRENMVCVFAGFFYARNIKETLLDRPMQRLAKSLFKAEHR